MLSNGDYRGIRYQANVDEGWLYVPLFDEKVDCWKPSAIKYLIQDMAINKRARQSLLEHRMGLAHREKIRELAQGGKRVLEWGCGASTLWYRQQGLNLVTVEHDPLWAAIIGGCMLFPIPNWPTRAEAAEGNPVVLKARYNINYVRCDGLGKFDVIIVDGVLRNACLHWAPNLINPNAIILLHDAQRPWYDLGKNTMISDCWPIDPTGEEGPQVDAPLYYHMGTLPECEDYKGPTLWMAKVTA